MVAGRRGEEAHAMFDRSAFGVGSAEIKPANASKGHRRRAHGTRFQRDVEIAIREPLAAERGGGGANGNELRVRGRIMISDRSVTGPRDDASVPHDYAANRHLAPRSCSAGLFEGDGHECGRWHVQS
jgi:hypothetical protein